MATPIVVTLPVPSDPMQVWCPRCDADPNQACVVLSDLYRRHLSRDEMHEARVHAQAGIAWYVKRLSAAVGTHALTFERPEGASPNHPGSGESLA